MSAETDPEFAGFLLNLRIVSGYLTKPMTGQLYFMNDLCEALRLLRGKLVLLIANMVLEVWREYNEDKPKTRTRKRAELGYRP
jgi:hypothetical protein